MVTNTSNSPKEVKYTGGIRDLTKTVVVNGKKINPIKRFDNPVDAYNDIYHDMYAKFNGKSSWVKPETTMEAYIHKFAPKEDKNDPKSYTQKMIQRLNSDLKAAGGSTLITNTSTLGPIIDNLIAVGIDPIHAFTKAHLKTEDPTVLRDLDKEPSSTLQSTSTSATTPTQNNIVKPNLETKVETKVKPVETKPVIQTNSNFKFPVRPPLVLKTEKPKTNIIPKPDEGSKEEEPSTLSNYWDMTKRFLVKKGIMDPEEQAQSTNIVKTPVVKKTENTKEEVPTFYKKLSETKSKRGGTVVSYINQFDRKKGFNYISTAFANEKDSTYNNVSHVAHFVYDMDFTTGKVNPSSDSETGNFKRKIKTVEDLKAHTPHNPGSTVRDPYVTLYQPVSNGKTNVQYIKKSEIEQKDIKNLGDVLRQYRYSDLDWEGPKGRAAGFASSIAAVKTKTGESTFFIQPKAAGNQPSKDYDQFGGGSVIYFIEGTDIAIDFGGSNYQIKKQAEDIIKNYKISPDKLIISYHDLGSYSAKPGGKDGKLSNKQYKNFNLSKGVGAALAIPMN